MLFAARLTHEELIFRRTSGVLAGFYHQLAVEAEHALSAAQRMLDEFGRTQIVVHRADSAEAEFCEIVGKPL